MTNRYRFGTKRLDADSDLYHFIARQYEADLGRFASRDPYYVIVVVSGYGFVSSRPTRLADPFGRLERDPGYDPKSGLWVFDYAPRFRFTTPGNPKECTQDIVGKAYTWGWESDVFAYDLLWYPLILGSPGRPDTLYAQLKAFVEKHKNAGLTYLMDWAMKLARASGETPYIVHLFDRPVRKTMTLSGRCCCSGGKCYWSFVDFVTGTTKGGWEDAGSEYHKLDEEALKEALRDTITEILKEVGG